MCHSPGLCLSVNVACRSDATTLAVIVLNTKGAQRNIAMVLGEIASIDCSRLYGWITARPH